MAINFPDSPSLNQEFQVGDRVWFWNGTVWKAQETAVLETGKYIVSDTAPPFPTEGDAWFDSVRTKEFIYYDDFWVETSAAAVGIAGLPEIQVDTAANYTSRNEVISTGTVAVESDTNKFKIGDGTTNWTSLPHFIHQTDITQLINNIINAAKGANDGIATLDSNGFVTASQLNVDLSTVKQEINSPLASDVTVEAGHRYFIDTTAPRTITLPLSPSLGDEVQLFDANGAGATNNVTVLNNSENINGVSDSLIIDVDGFSTKLVYTGSTYGWSVS